MLMITRTDGSDQTRTLKLQGKLLGPWVAELDSACAEPNVRPESVRLDLCELTFVDAAGTRFLERLILDGAKVVACSAFIAEVLRLERL